MLNLGLLTSSFALDSFPPDIFQHICPKLSAVDRTHLDMSGSKTLKVKTDQAIDALIKKRLQDIQMELDQSPDAVNIQTLYDALPIDKSSPRAGYNLLHHSNMLKKIQLFQTPVFIDFLSQFNNSFMKMKYAGLLHGEYGYTQDPVVARELLEKLVDKKHSWAIRTKFFNLNEGDDGYIQDTSASHKLVEEAIGKDALWAIQIKYRGLKKGLSGYTRDHAAAREFIKKS